MGTLKFIDFNFRTFLRNFLLVGLLLVGTNLRTVFADNPKLVDDRLKGAYLYRIQYIQDALNNKNPMQIEQRIPQWSVMFFNDLAIFAEKNLNPNDLQRFKTQTFPSMLQGLRDVTQKSIEVLKGSANHPIKKKAEDFLAVINAADTLFPGVPHKKVAAPILPPLNPPKPLTLNSIKEGKAVQTLKSKIGEIYEAASEYNSSLAIARSNLLGAQKKKDESVRNVYKAEIRIQNRNITFQKERIQKAIASLTKKDFDAVFKEKRIQDPQFFTVDPKAANGVDSNQFHALLKPLNESIAVLRHSEISKIDQEVFENLGIKMPSYLSNEANTLAQKKNQAIEDFNNLDLVLEIGRFNAGLSAPQPVVPAKAQAASKPVKNFASNYKGDIVPRYLPPLPSAGRRN